jgi:hypothetical protein
VPNKIDNILNHIVFVVDESLSMQHLRAAVIDVMDKQVKSLAAESKTMNQETRVTVYAFNHEVRNLVWDMDVLRLPSIRDHYHPNGNTALIDAAMQAITDLQLTPETYGDHSYLLFLITDGEENHSRKYGPASLSAKIAGLPDSWTVAALVPNVLAVRHAKNQGFPAGNIMVWDATSVQGVEEAGQHVNTATSNYMALRSTGTTSTKNLFALDPNAVNKNTIQAAGLTPLDSSKYMLVPVVPNRNKWPDDKIVVSDYVRDNGLRFQLGKCFYQFVARSVKVQGNKELMLVGKKDSKVYSGPQVRQLIGLPDHDVSIKRGSIHPDYDLFIQSTAPNRHLVPGTKVLVLK